MTLKTKRKCKKSSNNADAYHAQREFHTLFGTERDASLVSSMDCIKIYGLVSKLKLRWTSYTYEFLRGLGEEATSEAMVQPATTNSRQPLTPSIQPTQQSRQVRTGLQLKQLCFNFIQSFKIQFHLKLQNPKRLSTKLMTDCEVNWV
jgi:hypothetical protein